MKTTNPYPTKRYAEKVFFDLLNRYGGGSIRSTYDFVASQIRRNHYGGGLAPNWRHSQWCRDAARLQRCAATLGWRYPD